MRVHAVLQSLQRVIEQMRDHAVKGEWDALLERRRSLDGVLSTSMSQGLSAHEYSAHDRERLAELLRQTGSLTELVRRRRDDLGSTLTVARRGRRALSAYAASERIRNRPS